MFAQTIARGKRRVPLAQDRAGGHDEGMDEDRSVESGKYRSKHGNLGMSPRFDGLTFDKGRRALAAALASLGREPAALDARLIVEHASRLSHAELLRDADAVMPLATVERLRALAARRLAGEPTSRLIGHRVFCDLDIEVHPDVLDPREDTEALVRLAAELRSGKGEVRTVLDLGTGSGALLCAILQHYPEAIGIGVDRSAAAVDAAQANLWRNGFGRRAFVAQGIWAEALRGPFDLIVSNPPYIATADLPGLPDEVRLHDPLMALDGGPDGFDAYRDIARDIRPLAAPNALLILEIGAGMRHGVEAVFSEVPARLSRVARDTGGHERAMAFEFD